MLILALIASSNLLASSSSSTSLYIPQLFKQIVSSNVSLLSLFLALDIILAPWLNIRSEGAEVAGIARYFLAKIAKIGNLSLLAFYYVSGLYYRLISLLN